MFASLASFAASTAIALTSLVQPAAATPQAFEGAANYNALISHTASYDGLMEGVRKNLDSYWGQAFTLNHSKKTYTAPGVSWLNEAGGTATACGTLQADDAPKEAAFYCERDKVMYYDSSFLNYIDSDYGWMGVEAVMAHEQGHHIQNLLGIKAASSHDTELQADCLAGTFEKWQSISDAADVNKGLLEAQFNSAGDAPGTPSSAPDSHGQGYERVQAFDNGWNGGIAACHLRF